MPDYPLDFLRAMRDLLGPEYEAFRAVLDEEPARALRLNPRRAGIEALMHGDLEGAVPWAPNGRYVNRDYKPGRAIAYLAGGFYMQDASAMAAAEALCARPGESVLDLCAAPGGKSGQIADALSGRGLLISNEPEPKRAKILSGNLERLGVSDCAVTNAMPEALSARFPDFFDAVLVDAPCSGEGMFRRDEGARTEWSLSRVSGCAARQIEILLEAAKMVAPGGRLIYSTCTFNRQENEGSLSKFLKTRSDFAPMDFSLPGVGSSVSGALRLFPHRLRGEGHFVAALLRHGEKPARVSPKTETDPAAEEALKALKEALPGDWLSDFPGYAPRLSGDTLWLCPASMPDLSGLRVLRAGLRLCEIRRGYVLPDHALAMALCPERFLRTLRLTQDEARAFLHGETVKTDQAGWRLAAYLNLPLGWGKGAGGTLKNHLPKGLRAV